MRVRGLKLGEAEGYDLEDPVAPRAGAWIETLLYFYHLLKFFVAPRAGAWIETERMD